MVGGVMFSSEKFDIHCTHVCERISVDGLLELNKAEEPDVLFLSETKLTKKEMDQFRWKLNMINMSVVDCVGRSGGLVLFCLKGVDVYVRWKGRYHIDAI